jgi:hypothetical protein
LSAGTEHPTRLREALLPASQLQRETSALTNRMKQKAAKIGAARLPSSGAGSSMDRASDYGSEGWGFDSLPARKRTTITPMHRRTWIPPLVGSILLGTATLLYGRGLNLQGCAGMTWFGDDSYCPPRIEVMWFELSEREVLVWSVITGATAGALLGLLVGWLFRHGMPAREARSGIGSAAVLVGVIAACTAPQPAPPIPQPDPFARYLFSASGMDGVLEVGRSPPSICYSTQSSPSRPISIVPSMSVSGPPPGPPTVSYTSRGNDFCDLAVDPALAEALILDPSRYLIRWRPEDGSPAFSSPLVGYSSE